jgi:TetR/AcrR family transcriptional repressor of nem operon
MTTAKAQQKMQTHTRIVDSAGRLLRSRGVSVTSVADVMKGAGRTVGGFYAHFASKSALIESVLHKAMRESRAKLCTGLEGLDAFTRQEKLLQRYLSAGHRDHPDQGCPIPAVLGDIARGHAGGKALAEELEAGTQELAGTPRNARARSSALASFALMVGGLTLARALRGTPLSDEVLQACRDYGRAALRGLRGSLSGGDPRQGVTD